MKWKWGLLLCLSTIAAPARVAILAVVDPLPRSKATEYGDSNGPSPFPKKSARFPPPKPPLRAFVAGKKEPIII